MAEQFPRDLVRGSLDLVILSVLADGPKYGYLIQKRISETTGDRLRVQAGTLYPLLHRLQAEKLIRSRWDDSTGRHRKWYELTVAGRRRLDRQARDWSRYVACLQQVLLRVLGAPAGPA